jgi:dihydroorotase
MGEKNIFRGYVVRPDGIRFQEIVSEKGIIASVTDVDPKEKTSVYKYSITKLVFPGIVDTHVHARQDIRGAKNYKETFATACRAAVRGGVAAFMDMPNNDVPPVDKQNYEAKKALVESQNLPIEIILYAGISKDSEPFSDDIPYKCFLGESTGSASLFFSDEKSLDESMKRYKGKSVSYHCELASIIESNKNKDSHESRRPAEAEIEAIKLALKMIAKYDIKGTICHISTAKGLELAEKAKKSGLDVAVEITPHHLYFDNTNRHLSQYPDLLKMNPPLREPEDRLALLDAIKISDLEIRWGSDHAPHTLDEKLESNPSGVPTLDTTGQIACWLIGQGVAPQRLAKIFYDSGRFFSRFSKKQYGDIALGYAAKFTLLETDITNIVEKEELMTKCRWSPWEDIEFRGKAKTI